MADSKRCYIFDIDGTLADLSHRLHHIQKDPKDWDAFFAACGQDEPIECICELARCLASAKHGPVVMFVSGRSDVVREPTAAWIEQHVRLTCPPDRLYMRKAGDHRPDNIVKSELLDRIIADGFYPAIVFEDRDQVVKMWRARGIPCAQVAEGKF